MRIEDVVGFSRGTISEQTTAEAKTATELKILKQRSYSANKDIQRALEKALKDTVYIMDAYCTLYKITPSGEYEISFEWDDSILVDRDSELDNRLRLVSGGLSSKLETRMWYFGETENQAKQALQKIDDEKKASMEINIVSQKTLGQDAQGKDMSGDNNNPDNQNMNSVAK
jgi:A118 family predicted phage portal protein